MLYRFPPDRFHIYPLCPFYAATGLLCPGCGATRALAALVHGNFAEAMHWNGLVVLLMPCLLLYGMAAYHQAVWDRTQLRLPMPAITALLGTAMAFGVGRNVL